MSDDEDDLWGGLDDDESKISVSSNLLEVRAAPRNLASSGPPRFWLRRADSHRLPSRVRSCSGVPGTRRWCTRAMRTRGA